VIEFSKLIISSLEMLPVTQSYSLVSFGNNATLDLDLASPEDMLVALDGLIYTGGKTNHADAISACHSSLLSSTERTRKNIMLLITDGYPSEPKDMPKESAEVAATEAKANGVFIIPIAIQLQFSPEPTPYLQSISSDGTVFDASDFDLLDGIEEDLLAQVSCQV
jgi:Mg-chelatase subunit ChlD